MKNKKITRLYFICALFFYLAAIVHFKRERSMGTTYLCLGSTFLCLGSVNLNKEKEEEAEEDEDENKK